MSKFDYTLVEKTLPVAHLNCYPWRIMVRHGYRVTGNIYQWRTGQMRHRSLYIPVCAPVWCATGINFEF